jgi:hypothetical protein
MKRILLLLIYLYCLTGFVHAQKGMVWPVYVDHLGEDFVGTQVMIKVNNALAEHANYTKLDSASNGELGFFRIMITSVATTRLGDWSAISVVYTLEFPDSPFGIYLNSAVYFRNKDTTEDLTRRILDNMDIAIKNYSIWRKAKDKTLRIN